MHSNRIHFHALWAVSPFPKTVAPDLIQHGLARSGGTHVKNSFCGHQWLLMPWQNSLLILSNNEWCKTQCSFCTLQIYLHRNQAKTPYSTSDWYVRMILTHEFKRQYLRLVLNEMSMLLYELQQAGPFAVAAMGGGPAAELFAAAVAQLQRVFFCLFLTLRKISNHIFIQIFLKTYLFINL